MKPEVLVVVVSYNGLEHTQRIVESLRAQQEPVRIVVWDNASEDGTPQWLVEAGVEAYLSTTNQFWTPAINQAIDRFWDGEPYIAYSNHDMFLWPQAIARLRRTLDEHPRAGAVGPMGRSLGGQQDWASFYGPWYELNPDLDDLENTLEGRPPKRVRFLAGAFVMMRKSVWDEIGPLDDEMYLGADDHDYGIRLRAAGYDLLVCEDVYVVHGGHVSAATAEGAENWNVHGQHSWDAFARKHPDFTWDGYADLAP